MPPGGGLKRGEDPLGAARRELSEETGCRLTDARLLLIQTENLHGARNHVRIVLGHAEGALRIDGREIVEARFFAVEDLPAEMSVSLAENLVEWIARR